MKLRVAFAILGLAVPLVFSVKDEPVVIEAEVGSRIILTGDPVEGRVTGCTARSGAGELLESFDAGREHFCEIDVARSRMDHAGTWILTTRTDDYRSYRKEFLVSMSQVIPVKPGSYVSASEGEWVFARLDGNSSDATAVPCTLRATTSDRYENATGYGGGVCGVRFRATAERSGEYELQRRLGEHATERGYFRVDVSTDRDNGNGRITRRRFDLGEPAALGPRAEDVAFCRFTKPDGATTRSQHGECLYRISAASELHAGVWRVDYALRTRVESFREEIHVTVADRESLRATRIPGPGREINLLCRVGAEVLEYCSFKRPDDRVINLPVAVGNDRYSYYGDGYNQERYSRYYADCGITIHEPSEIDFGAWECEAGVRRGNVVVPRGGIARVAEARDEPVPDLEPSRAVVVKSGDSFKIGCKANEPLDYCWLTAPNGTTYAVLPGASSTSNLLGYDGDGLSAGECGAIVERATASDSGEWTCHLGISASGEYESTVSVRVADSYLVPAERLVRGDRRVQLTCRTYLEEKGTPEYCRWIRPDGTGLSRKDAAKRYATDARTDSCRLTISEIGAEDIGEWTCAAALTGAPNEEQRASLRVESTRAPPAITSVVSIVSGCALLTVALVGSFFAAIYLYRRRKRRDEKKLPPLYDPDVGGSRASRTDPVDVATSKRYEY